ncbi:hypothetical protein PG996_005073 [Apiospora saccharicola]|uniref:Uncharacterized protein n=1 Tax=Apiospora saccharicola TaxID=335842 RepID=A0ABR1VKG1_9PEZI
MAGGGVPLRSYRNKVKARVAGNTGIEANLGRVKASVKISKHPGAGGTGASQKSRVGQGWLLLSLSPNHTAKADSPEYCDSI